MMRFLLFFFLLGSALGFDQTHRVWNEMLKRHLVEKDGQTYVNYKKFLDRREKLNDYLKSMSDVKPVEFGRFNKEEQLAFLINAYNAFTIAAILDNIHVKSIKDIKKVWGEEKGWFSSVWKIKFFHFLGQKRSLDWIEHEKLRKDYKEPRIHAAINCASIGCPALRSEAFVAEKLEEQLEEGMKSFLNDKTKNYFDSKEKKLKLSQIFEWFGEDFKESGGVKEFALKYMSLSADETQLAIKSEVEFNEYDWSLNSINE